MGIKTGYHTPFGYAGCVRVNPAPSFTEDYVLFENEEAYDEYLKNKYDIKVETREQKNDG